MMQDNGLWDDILYTCSMSHVGQHKHKYVRSIVVEAKSEKVES